MLAHIRYFVFFMVGLLALSACSEEASITLILPPTVSTAKELINKLEIVSDSIDYTRGHFNVDEKTDLTLLEDVSDYKLYFINKQYRTTIEFDIVKKDLSTKVTFSEFGVKDFSDQGLQQLKKLKNEIIKSFGQHLW